MNQECKHHATWANVGDPSTNLCALAEVLYRQIAPRDKLEVRAEPIRNEWRRKLRQARSGRVREAHDRVEQSLLREVCIA